MDTLAGKVAVVNGDSRGIGRATDERLEHEGASVVVNYVENNNAVQVIVAVIVARGGTALAIQADVARLDDIRRLFRETVERLGRLDMLIANAGYSVFKPLVDITEDDFEQTYRLNTKG